jgi:uncharacterized glyoxalase superfamily protein PhnB
MSQTTRPPPPGWPRISSTLFYEDPTMLDWLVRAFGFEVRLKVEGDGGEIVHSELTFGDGLIMVGTGRVDPDGAGRNRAEKWRSPKALGGANTQSLCVHVDDVDAHHAQAVAAGARIVRELATEDYGEAYWANRGYMAADPEGHLWYFAQRVRGPGA